MHGSTKLKINLCYWANTTGMTHLKIGLKDRFWSATWHVRTLSPPWKIWRHTWCSQGPSINVRVNINTDIRKSECASEDWNHPGVRRKTRQCNLLFDNPRSIACEAEQESYPQEYRGADKFLARPGRKQVRKYVRDARDFNNIETRAVIKFFFPCKARRRRKFTPFWQKH